MKNNNMEHQPRKILQIGLQLYMLTALAWIVVNAEGCPDSQLILPCRCSLRGQEIQIWCSHSSLPQVMEGIKSVERNIQAKIDEFVLENNQLPALPGRFFGSLQIVRLMLRNNAIERLSNGWLNELQNSLLEIFIVEPELRSIPAQSLHGMINLFAITIQSDVLKHLPDFSGLLSLNYLNVQSNAIAEIPQHAFYHLPKIENLQIAGGLNVNRLQDGLFDSLISLQNIDFSHNGINWIHLRAFSRLQKLTSLKLSYNQISDLGMIGRMVKDLDSLKKLRLDHNIITVVNEGTFVDLPYLTELHLNDNQIERIQYGAFLRVSMLKIIYLHNNHIKHIHPESFLQASGSGVEAVYIYNNQIEHVDELRSLLDALPALKFLDISNNLLKKIPFGSLRGHATLEQLHLNHNLLHKIDHDAFMAMPALRELRLHNNSLDSNSTMPFWNLPGIKGLDLSKNQFREAHASLLTGLPSLRRLDLSENGLAILDPATFVNNPLLETLNISNNKLDIIHPATFRNLDHLFEVDASNNNLIEIIPGLPKIVERISISGNAIKVLPKMVHKALNLPNLRMLDLSNNHLELLPKYGLKGVPQLRVLSLANNRLRSLDDTSFVGIKRLELLHLQENELVDVDERAFLSLSELRNLNMQGNKLQKITDNMLSNNTQLEQLDLSRNHIRSIAPSAFEMQRSLEYLDLSGNTLTDISDSLSNLVNLRDIDLSYNEISSIHADVVSAWNNIIEIRLSNNLITELQRGTFQNLPKLQYLDLSSNEIASVDMGALKQLPDLQELVLADNKLAELNDHTFEDLPNLLASHFQYNQLRYIASESFYNSPSVVFLNLSSNHFRSMDNIGLGRMYNLEVLDLSANGVKLISTMPLRGLNWLVELKMDNNEICKIQGSPFETMPRLRVLSLRNNRLRTMQEPTFRNLRGNIAILDVDGNPIVCSCDMQWFSVWLQETKFPYPGPKCPDGRLLRSSRIDKNLCSMRNEKIGTGNSESTNESPYRLPLLNEHGDLFQREITRDFHMDNECDVHADGERPLVEDSEYFSDQYVDYTPPNEAGSMAHAVDPGSNLKDANTMNFDSDTTKSKPYGYSKDPNNDTILNTKYLRPGLSTNPQSAFTFFGYPLPNINLGRFFGLGPRGRKERGEGISMSKRNLTATLPATHRTHSTRGKFRMYQPKSADFEKYLSEAKPPQSQYNDVISRNRYLESDADDAVSNEMLSGTFKSGFRAPTLVHYGGFRPIVTEHSGGFMPMLDPTKQHETVNQTVSVPRNSLQKEFVSYTASNSTIITKKEHQTVPPVNMSRLESDQSEADLSTETPVSTTIAPVPRLNITEKIKTKHSSTPALTTPPIPITTSSESEPDYYDDLQAESFGMHRPPELSYSTTAQTILLIPPPEEHAAQIKRQSWISSSTTIVPDAVTFTNKVIPDVVAPRSGRPAGGRSTVVKVNNPNNEETPTANEFHRTTASIQFEDLMLEDAQKRNFQLDDTSYQIEKSSHKHDMDWYYESFKKTHNKSPQNDYVPAVSLYGDQLSHRNSAGKVGLNFNLWHLLSLQLILTPLSLYIYCIHI